MFAVYLHWITLVFFFAGSCSSLPGDWDLNAIPIASDSDSESSHHPKQQSIQQVSHSVPSKDSLVHQLPTSTVTSTGRREHRRPRRRVEHVHKVTIPRFEKDVRAFLDDHMPGHIKGEGSSTGSGIKRGRPSLVTEARGRLHKLRKRIIEAAGATKDPQFQPHVDKLNALKARLPDMREKSDPETARQRKNEMARQTYERKMLRQRLGDHAAPLRPRGRKKLLDGGPANIQNARRHSQEVFQRRKKRILNRVREGGAALPSSSGMGAMASATAGGEDDVQQSKKARHH
jgi:hypothetical protein